MEHSNVDSLWVLISAGLVFIMQAGFLCLETGLTRTKNAINVAIKNLTDFGISAILFWLLGFAIMFGASFNGWIGVNYFWVNFDPTEHWLAVFFLFQLMFCATSVTIVSGAVAERMRFDSYIFVCIITSSLIYPLFGHWAWGAFTEGMGWLRAKGFVDFAGSSVVHSVGGWVALAAVLIIGPRLGRFSQGQVNKIPGSNLPFSILGVILLFFGWFGFNGGSTLAMNEQVPLILVNTTLGAAAGLVTALFVGWLLRGYSDVALPVNGTLAGLVAITANCHAVTTGAAIIIGAVGALVMLAVEYLLERCHVDDAVGAIPVHAGAGVWGTIAVALFGKPELLGTGLNFGQQLQVQILGIIVCFVFSFGTAYLLLRIINRFWSLRVTEDEEKQGLNVSEHKATTELVDLLGAMHYQAQTGNLNHRVPVEPFTEVGQIAKQYNIVLDSLQKMMLKTKAVVDNISESIITFAEDGLLISLNPMAEKVFGFSSGELIGQDVRKIIHCPPNRVPQNSSNVFDDIAKESLETPIELNGMRKDGSQFLVEVVLSKSAVDSVNLYTGILRDITERKKFENTLRESEERNRSIIETANDAFVSISEQGIITQWNNRAEKTFGWTRSEAIGKELAELIIPQKYRDAHRKGLEHYLATGQGPVLNKTLELTALGRSGNEFPIEITIWKVELNQRQHFNAFIRDITERKEAETKLKTAYAEIEQKEKSLRETFEYLQKSHDELKQAQNQLIQSEKLASIGQLAAGVAHEINNPVGFINNNMEVLGQYIGDYGKMLRMVNNLKAAIEQGDLEKARLMVEEMTKFEQEINLDYIINDINNLLQHNQRGIERIQKIVLDLRTFSREDKEATELVKIEEVIDSILSIVHNELKYKAELKKSYGETPLIKCNAQRLGQVFINLFVNAAQAMDEKGTIEVKTYTEGKFVCVDVVDTGKGIPEENLKKVFDAFFTTKPVGQGTGLGLSVSYEIVKKHGGEIKVQSKVGEGTTFTVMLPIT